MGAEAEGFSAADTLTELGAVVTVVAGAEPSADRLELLAIIGAKLADASDEAAIDQLRQSNPDLVIVSPHFDSEHSLVAWALARGIPVWSELELAWRLRDKVRPDTAWLVMTGRESIDRAAHLTESMLISAGQRTMACGATAAGVPVLDAIRVPGGWDSLVVAASAHALRFSSTVSAWSSACLDAGDSDSEGFDADLARVFDDTQIACIYHRGVPATMSMVEEADVIEGCRAISVGFDVPGPSGFGIVEGILCDRAFLDERHSSALEFATLELLADAGLDTQAAVTDVLVSAALARSIGAPIAAITAALRPPTGPA
jgi:UDP-N-acetylmuramoylalanine--D-glutamate ligase